MSKGIDEGVNLYGSISLTLSPFDLNAVDPFGISLLNNT